MLLRESFMSDKELFPSRFPDVNLPKVAVPGQLCWLFPAGAACTVLLFDQQATLAGHPVDTSQLCSPFSSLCLSCSNLYKVMINFTRKKWLEKESSPIGAANKGEKKK